MLLGSGDMLPKEIIPNLGALRLLLRTYLCPNATNPSTWQEYVIHHDAHQSSQDVSFTV